PSSRKGSRPRMLAPLTAQTIQRFVIGERPNGPLDNAYARCVTTLRQPNYPRYLYDLAVRIDSDGIDHYSKFSDVARVIAAYQGAVPPDPYLREVRPGTPEQAREALDEYAAIVQALQTAYIAESEQSPQRAQASIAEARAAMDRLLAAGERLAAQGIGIPFWQESAVAATT